jgi:hypothetical protein
MSENQKWNEGYKKLKEIVKKIVNPKREKTFLQPALQQSYPHKQKFSRG